METSKERILDPFVARMVEDSVKALWMFAEMVVPLSNLHVNALAAVGSDFLQEKVPNKIKERKKNASGVKSNFFILFV